MDSKLQQALNTLATAAQLASLPYRDHLLCLEAVKLIAEELNKTDQKEIKENSCQ